MKISFVAAALLLLPLSSAFAGNSAGEVSCRSLNGVVLRMVDRCLVCQGTRVPYLVMIDSNVQPVTYFREDFSLELSLRHLHDLAAEGVCQSPGNDEN